MALFNGRRKTWEVDVAGHKIGGLNPILVQSMTNTSTNDVDGSIKQIIELYNSGAAIVRLTAQGQKEIDSLKTIKERLRADHIPVPLVADIHFNTKAAFAASEVVDKVRINPGNFVDPGRVFRQIDYSDEEYKYHLNELSRKVADFFNLCKKNNVAVRIGVNHGSLSDRIMSRYGNTPEGMVESAIEFLRIAVQQNFYNIIVSIKSSNTRIMVETVRKMAMAMEREKMFFPLHLGVTEAGEGEDGRIKSAIGIGTLLYQGLGDTIRVSLSEDPVNEIPVANELISHINRVKQFSVPLYQTYDGFNPLKPQKRKSTKLGIIGGDNTPVVVADINEDRVKDLQIQPDFNSTEHFINISTKDINKALELINGNSKKPVFLFSDNINQVDDIKSFIHRLTALGTDVPIIVNLSYPDELEKWQVIVRASADFGALLMDNLIDGVSLTSKALSPDENINLLFGILQGTRNRITKTEYIACPGCGRTLFELSDIISKIKLATSHLKGMKIGIMGCIVNGPGEMADADYGYVGAAKGKISLYRGKDCIEKNIEQDNAVNRLIAIIKEDNRWIDP